MFKNILVPFDYSEPAKRAIAAALEMADPGAVITLLEAANSPWIEDPTTAVAERMAGVVISDTERAAAVSHYWENMAARLEKVAADAQESADQDVTFKSKVMSGSPASIIVQYAKDNEADLIVMGRRGLSGVRELLGSVSHKVTRDANLPILLVK